MQKIQWVVVVLLVVAGKKQRQLLFVLSEEDQALAELGHSAQPQYSTVVPVEAEMFKFINYMKSIMLNENDIDTLPCPLTFYSKGNFGGDNLPILSRIASIIFPCSPASGDVERTNSKAGKVLSPSRQSLKPATVSSIVFLKGIYSEHERRPTHREKLAKKNFRNLLLLWDDLASWLEGIERNQKHILIVLIVFVSGSVQKRILTLKLMRRKQRMTRRKQRSAN